MKALDFIKEYAKIHPGAILGSYCLHLLHNTAYNDIDYFTPLLTDAIDTSNTYVCKEFRVKQKIYILGREFSLKGNNYPKEFEFAAYECTDFDDVPVNLVMVPANNHRKLSFYRQIDDIIMGFDLDILRVKLEPYYGFTEVSKTKYYYDCIATKKILCIIRNDTYKSWHDTRRIKRYKERFPEYTFVKCTEELL